MSVSFIKSGEGGGSDRAAPEFLEEGGVGRERWGQTVLVWKLYFQSSTLFLWIEYVLGVT